MADRQVKVSLVIDDKGSVKVLRQAGEESSRTERHLGKLDRSVKGLGGSFKGLKGLLAGGLGALGIGGVAFGLSSIAEKTKEVASETEKFHTVTGIATGSSLAYTQALKARGLSGETVNKAFGFLAKNLRSAELQEKTFGSSQAKAAAKGKIATSVLGRQATAFKELGINLKQFNDLSEQGKIEEITKRFEALAPGIQKTRLERELFGRGGSALSTVLEKNNLGLSHQLELVKKFFPTVKGGANAMNELLEKQAESKMAWEGLEFTLGQKLIPAMTAVMGWFSGIAAEAQKGKGPLHEIEVVFEGIAHFAGGAIGVAKDLFKIFGVKLPGGTLGAVLAAVGLHSVKHPAKVTKTVGKDLGKAAKFAAEHPWLAPIAIGGAAGTVLSEATPNGLAPGLEGWHPHGPWSPFGSGPSKLHPGETTISRSGGTGGKPKLGAESPAEAQALVRAIESLKATGSHDQYVLNMDGAKVAEGLLKNTRARRILAEAMSTYAQQMAARK